MSPPECLPHPGLLVWGHTQERDGNIDPLPAPRAAGTPSVLVRAGKSFQSYRHYLGVCPTLELKWKGSETCRGCETRFADTGWDCASALHLPGNDSLPTPYILPSDP